jgi:ADP-ribose pyrophosphatase
MIVRLACIGYMCAALIGCGHARREEVLNAGSQSMGEPATRETRALREYFELAQEQPAWFRNPDAADPVGYEILLNRGDIDAAEAARAGELQRQNYPPEWAQVGVVFEDQYLRVLRDAVRKPGRRLGTYIRIVAPANGGIGVAILPLWDDKVVLVDHHRHATRERHLEMPRGFGEPGTSWEDNARRELQEEIGANPIQVVDLGYLHTNTGISSERVQLVFARIQSLGGPEQAEGIAAIVTLSIAQLEDRIAGGIITDSFTIAAYARARLRGFLP